jgi:HEAT repeat protein
LTEEERKALETFGGNWASPSVFKNEKEAIKYLKMLLKGDEKSIPWYQNVVLKNKENEEKWNKWHYGSCIATALHAINTRTNKEGFALAVEVLKTKKGYPEAIVGAAEAIGKGLKDPGDEQVIRLLREFSGYPDSMVRLYVGEALLKAGDSDTALQILDDVTKEGKTTALGFIFETMDGKKWEQEGIENIKKALTYENKESKALAALFVIRLTNKGRLREDLGKIENMLLEMLDSILNKQKWDEPIQGKGYSDGRTVRTIISAFQTLRSHKAIPFLKRLSTHPEGGYLGRRAQEAISQIESSGGRK